jgi:hypothetical protein
VNLGAWLVNIGTWLWANADKVGAIAQVFIGAAAVAALLVTVLALRGTQRAITLQRKELEALESQVELDNRRYLREQVLARPRLRIADVIVRDSNDGLQPAEVKLKWSHGADPADQLEVWVCTQSKVFCGREDYMAATDHELLVRLVELPHSERDEAPFAWKAHTIGGNVFWVGVVWTRTDGLRVGFSEQFVDHNATLIEGGIERETITRNQGRGPESPPDSPSPTAG